MFYAIGDWKLATASDVVGRRGLFEWLMVQVKAEVGVSVMLDEDSNSAGQHCLTRFYADQLYDLVFRTLVGLTPYSIELGQLKTTDEGNVYGYNESLVLGCDEGERGRTIRLLLEGPHKLSHAPIAKPAGKAYRHADITTQGLKGALADFLQRAGRTPDTRCEACKPWFQALGVANEAPGWEPGPSSQTGASP